LFESDSEKGTTAAGRVDADSTAEAGGLAESELSEGGLGVGLCSVGKAEGSGEATTASEEEDVDADSGEVESEPE
jgi:hypothetical protein